ncbi:MAG: hypothetical protein ACKO6N_03370 [Myxococcota bacterium]
MQHQSASRNEQRSEQRQHGRALMRLGLVMVAAASVWLSTAAQGNNGECVSRCNMQYLASLKQCDQVLAQNGRRDWHADCLKNAQRFRMDCLRRCR